MLARALIMDDVHGTINPQCHSRFGTGKVPLLPGQFLFYGSKERDQTADCSANCLTSDFVPGTAGQVRKDVVLAGEEFPWNESSHEHFLQSSGGRNS